MSSSDVRAAVESAFRDFNTEGVSGSGAYEPEKAAIRAALGETLEDALQALENSAIMYGDGGTPNAIVATARGTMYDYPAEKIAIYSHFIGTNTGAAVTLKVGALPAAQVVDQTFNPIPAGFLRTGYAYLLQYYPGSTSYWRVIYPRYFDLNADAFRRIRCVDLATGAAGMVYNTQSAYGGEVAYDPAAEYVFTALSGGNTGTPRFKLDALPDLPIFESNGFDYDAVKPNRMQMGQDYTLRFIPFPGDNFFVIRDPVPTVRRSTDVPLALNLAEAAQRSARAAFLRAVDVNAIPRTTIFERDFSNNAHAADWKIAHGGGSDSVPSYDAYTYSSDDGGYGSGIFGTSSAPGAVNTAWWDHNHIYPGPVWLNILGSVATTNAGGPIPAPATGGVPMDCRYLRLTLGLRFLNFVLPEAARIILHTQHQDKTVGAGGTGKAFNMAFMGKIIDEVAMQADAATRPNAGFGLTFPPQSNTINNAASQNIVFDFVPDDAFWLHYGGSEGRANTYRAAAAEYVLQQTWLNFHIHVIQPQQVNRRNPAARPTGEMRVDYLKVERKN